MLLVLISTAAIGGIWWGFEPPFTRGLVVSVLLLVFLVAWHWLLLRYLKPKTFVQLDDFGTVEEHQVRAAITNLIEDGRYALLLRPQVASDLPPDQFAAARQCLETAAALVPGGQVEQGLRILTHDVAGAPPSLVHVPSFWIDRHPVTNRQYHRFVASGGYTQAALWEPEAQTLIARFVDRSGSPGPAFWEAGIFLPGTEEHPVVGVSWYEALAFARWVGKRLPNDAQWLKVAGWPVSLVPAQAGTLRLAKYRYPWGDRFEEGRANLRPGGSGQLVPVSEYAAGSSSQGVHQLLGNVWEWTSEELEHLPSEVAASRTLSRAGQMAASLKITRGGAYDTELDGQSSAELVHAKCPLTRAPNIGFRCALAWSDILPASALAGHRPPPTATWLLPMYHQQSWGRRPIAATHDYETNYLRNCYEEDDPSIACAAGASDCSTQANGE